MPEKRTTVSLTGSFYEPTERVYDLRFNADRLERGYILNGNPVGTIEPPPLPVHDLRVRVNLPEKYAHNALPLSTESVPVPFERKGRSLEIRLGKPQNSPCSRFNIEKAVVILKTVYTTRPRSGCSRRALYLFR